MTKVANLRLWCLNDTNVLYNGVCMESVLSEFENSQVNNVPLSKLVSGVEEFEIIIGIFNSFLNKYDHLSNTEFFTQFSISRRTIDRMIVGETRIQLKNLQKIARFAFGVDDLKSIATRVDPRISGYFLLDDVSNNEKFSIPAGIPFEIRTNEKLMWAWCMTMGDGYSYSQGKAEFGEEFDEILNVLLKYKMIKASSARDNHWIFNDVISSNADVFHMWKMLTKKQAERCEFSESNDNSLFAWVDNVSVDDYAWLNSEIELLKKKLITRCGNSKDSSVKFVFGLQLSKVHTLNLGASHVQ